MWLCRTCHRSSTWLLPYIHIFTPTKEPKWPACILKSYNRGVHNGRYDPNQIEKCEWLLTITFPEAWWWQSVPPGLTHRYWYAVLILHKALQAEVRIMGIAALHGPMDASLCVYINAVLGLQVGHLGCVMCCCIHKHKEKSDIMAKCDL